MRNLKHYIKIHCRFIPLLLLLFCFTLFLGRTVTADTLYLRDGSVLNGDILEEKTEDFLIDNPGLGQLYVLREDIIYRETPQADTLCESFMIVGQGLDIIAHLSRSVPEIMRDAESFNLLVNGNVLSVIDADGSDITFEKWSIGDSDLITIDYDQLGPETERLSIITKQQGLIQAESGLYVFRLKYILNQDSRVRIIIKYPQNFHLESIKPEPKIKGAGIIVWDQQIKRQQHFVPEIRFIP
jgi:hypothetical protein